MPRICCTSVLTFVCLGLAVGCGDSGRKAVAGPPARVEEAAKVLDLAALPLPEGAEGPGRRGLAQLTFNAPGSAKTLFDEQRKYFRDHGWSEEPTTYVSDESCSATFTKDGYSVSLSTIPTGDGKVMVAIQNHGNVDLAKLPVPASAKLSYGGPTSAIFFCDHDVAATKAEVDRLLQEKGWQPYGEAGDMRIYKQNAIRLNAMINSSPAQGGKTAITYNAQLMSADLPAPQGAENIRFTETPTVLQFETAQPVSDVAGFYRKALAEQGWKATTDETIHDDKKDELIFRNPQKDLIWLTMRPSDSKLQVKLEHQTAAEVEAIEKRLREQLEKKQ